MSQAAGLLRIPFPQGSAWLHGGSPTGPTVEGNTSSHANAWGPHTLHVSLPDALTLEASNVATADGMLNSAPGTPWKTTGPDAEMVLLPVPRAHPVSRIFCVS